LQDYVGYRTKKRREKKQKRKSWKVLLVVALLLCIFVILGAAVKVSPFDAAWEKTEDGFLWVGRKVRSIWPFNRRSSGEPVDFVPEGKQSANYLFVATKQFAEETQATSVVLASYDSVDNYGSLIYFPSDLMVDVPGIGMEQLSNLVELDEGRISMMMVTVENLLGVQVDRYVLGTDRDLRIILNQMAESFAVDVPGKVSFKDESLDVTVDLSPGVQNISGNTLASYLTYSEPGKRIDLITRQEVFVPEFFEISRGLFDDTGMLIEKNANLLDTDASDQELTGIWQTFSLLEDALLQGVLPVNEFRFEKTVVHRLDEEKLKAFIDKYVNSGSSETFEERYRVQLLNGCGTPGIGEQVASEIDLDSFEIIGSGNADNFDYQETIFVIFSDDEGVLGAAEKLVNQLEVGRVEAHPQTQNVSDITVIVGKDYASK